MFRKTLTLSMLFPSLAVAQPPIQDCRAFLLDETFAKYLSSPFR